MGKPVKIFDLAEQMIYLANLTPEVDIPIKITGLRPGEKLHESLVCSNETVIPTEHPKIMAVSSQFLSAKIFSSIIPSLSQAVTNDLSIDELWAITMHHVNALESPHKVS
jgi:FlaA1/EpsC-like NDP-sugar epimerase